MDSNELYLFFAFFYRGQSLFLQKKRKQSKSISINMFGICWRGSNSSGPAGPQVGECLPPINILGTACRVVWHGRRGSTWGWIMGLCRPDLAHRPQV